MAQINVAATFDYLRRALAVKEPGELFALNQEFARNQLAAITEQATELSELTLRLAKEAGEPLQEGWRRSFRDLSNRLAA